MRPATGDRDRLDPDRPRCGPGRGGAGPALPAMVLAMLSMAMPTAARAADGPAADARMSVTGRVLDPSGKPVPGAAVMVIARSRMYDRPMLLIVPFGPMTAHEGRCDESGRFRVVLPRTSSARHDAVVATAIAPGYGIGWAELDPDAESPTADVALRTEQVIRGRLLDTRGQPARKVALRVQAVSRVARGGIWVSIFRPDLLEPRWRDFPAWPGPATSDDDGSFTLRGLGRGPMYPLIIDDPRFTLVPTVIQTDPTADLGEFGTRQPAIEVEPGPDPKPIAITLQPARTITGSVIDAETGQPVPHAVVSIPPRQYQADATGRFRGIAAPLIVRFVLQAHSPDGAPYLIGSAPGGWPEGMTEQSVDIDLPRGVAVRGKVVEEGTGRPIAGAVVRFLSITAAGEPPWSSSAPAVTAADGSYRVAAPPEAGYLVVQASDEDHVLRELGGALGPLQAGPGRVRCYAHAYRALDLKPDGPAHEVDFALRRGAAIHGRAVDPDGQPVRDAWIFSRIVLQTWPTGAWKQWRVYHDIGRGQVHDGRFALHGLDAGIEIPVHFLEPERRLGATVRFSGKSAAGPVTVRLEPCGTARARLVAPAGKPLDRYPARGLIAMVVTPGPPFQGNPAKEGPLYADEEGMVRVDPINYKTNLPSDAQGRVTYPALIPGASYRILDYTATTNEGGPAIRKEFTVKPGEALDLGDILIARPRRGN